MELQQILDVTKDYFTDRLIPFWAKRAYEPKYGGFQTNYNKNGERTNVTEKTLLCQGRCIFTFSHVLRSGFHHPDLENMVEKGIQFLLKYFKDQKYGGYYWIVSEKGKPRDDNKVIYGHSFLIYGLAEYALLTGNENAKNEALEILDLILTNATDTINGGYNEHFDRRFNPKITRKDNIYHKSLDVHMHLMEAFTTLYELTGEEKHRILLEQIIDLIFEKMIDKSSGTGMPMFTKDWDPLPNTELKMVWGSDRFEKKEKDVSITSYGHNIELGWLYLHALDILGTKNEQTVKRAIPLFEHTINHGIDWDNGGLFVEGKRNGKPTDTNKEFWQQAEALTGFLDAYIITRNVKYLDAFKNIHKFVFEKMINWDQGEWFPLLDKEGRIIWDYMGHNWKICYHTMRSTGLVIKKLHQIIRGN